MRKLYVCQTRIGPFYIAEHNGRYHPVFQDESLGGYSTPKKAIEDLAGGYTFSNPSGVDPGTLGIPEELEDWERCLPDGTVAD